MDSEGTQSTQDLRDLKELLYEGFLTKEVKVRGFNMKIRTITGEEQTIAFDRVRRYDDFARISQIRIEILTFAVEAVNGEPLEVLYKSPSDPALANADKDITAIEKKRSVLKKLSHSVLNDIFAEYTIISDEAQKTEDKGIESDDDTVKNS